MDDSTQEPISSSNIKKYVNLLLKRYQTNQNDRITNPDDPEKWIKSEVDLDEHIRLFADLSTIPSLYPQFLNLGGFKVLSDILSHQNIDIVIPCITVLSELLDPEIIFNLNNTEDFLKELEFLSIHKLCINGLLKIEEDNGEMDYNGVKSSFELIENLVEITPSVINDMATNVDLLGFLIKRMKTSKTMEYDSNRIHASEILCIILQGSEEAVVKVGNKDPLDGIDAMLRIIAIYRKRDPESIEEEELVENVFQCLCRLMFNKDNQLRFGKIQGLQLAIRLIRERRKTYKQALKLLDYALLDCPENCKQFVVLFGLKCIFSVLMRKGVSTKVGSEEEKQEDENVVSVLNSLCSHCNGEELSRVVNKFVENKHEKLERIVELHKKYTQRSKALLKKIEQNKQHSKEIFDMLSLNEGEQSYLDKYEAGLSICQMIDCVMVRLYNVDNKNLPLCLLVLLHNKGVDIQDIYNNVSDFLEHLSEDARDTREVVEGLLKNFLMGAKNSGYFD
ncbi:uncharacterized protein TOT_020001057 [Theileria orientalis strain Shintoku]|uniref:Beta-catenin-like protein 1 N-terminal domain-containing protein n=1 Tax=Theileria orientalis strain Shintoku TaxID=869250 RepID=J4C844_THEOR|nr:uncharacterized protein TOT_020001057 [Theileria orientalis strain Shintoku]BAM40143.1 uncharacterized protein TOT_020001057 [Theileria orientalis strain Shintoku]|eukprot:XP_009690444.1 uncharacterized protein TOT_020001057 [Theileria orientalis strain Shintoku]